MAMKCMFTVAEAFQHLVADSDSEYISSGNSVCNSKGNHSESENEVDDEAVISYRVEYLERLGTSVHIASFLD